MTGSHRKIVKSYALSMTINFCTSKNSPFNRFGQKFHLIGMFHFGVLFRIATIARIEWEWTAFSPGRFLLGLPG
jgi:hypothetical protein